MVRLTLNFWSELYYFIASSVASHTCRFWTFLFRNFGIGEFWNFMPRFLIQYKRVTQPKL